MSHIASTYEVPCIYETLKTSRDDSPKRRSPLAVTVPGSKSITNRALLLATLAEGVSTLRGVLFSDDSRHFLKCIQDLGIETTVKEPEKIITVKGHGGAVPCREASLYVGSAGTAARFLTAYLGVSDGIYHLDASPQMRKRPMAPLLDSLQELGCQVRYGAWESPLPTGDRLSGGTTAHSTSADQAQTDDTHAGHFPYTLAGHGFCKDHITVDIGHSSQFLSALLIASCLSDRDFTTCIEGSHGMSYIQMTLQMMAQFGVQVEQTSPRTFLTRAGQHYEAQDYCVEPDASAACYFYALSPLLGIPVTVPGIHFHSLQGDVAFLHLLARMGCTVTDSPQGIIVCPPENGSFHGITADMSACSDQAITLAAIAPFADGPTTIQGIGHIRFQESDRIRAVTTELTKMGIHCEEREDSITVYPGCPTPSLVETYDDHRMAMGFALPGLRSPGIVIDNPGCCCKTFENYFQVLDQTIRCLI